MSVNLGATDYRNSANERLREAGILLQREYFAGAVYLAGRAVEAILRALLWKHDVGLRTGKRSLDTGHDLREMLSLVEELGILRQGDVVLLNVVQRIGRLWSNNMRFMPTSKLRTLWWDRGEIARKRTLKLAVQAFYDDCSGVIKRCEVLYAKDK